MRNYTLVTFLAISLMCSIAAFGQDAQFVLKKENKISKKVDKINGRVSAGHERYFLLKKEKKAVKKIVKEEIRIDPQGKHLYFFIFRTNSAWYPISGFVFQLII